MPNTYTTTVNSLKTINNNYVVDVLFTVSGTDGTNTASIDGNCQFFQNKTASIIPYANLTQEIILQWINEATDNLVNYYANIDGQIASMITPPVSPQNTELPWLAGTFTIE